VDEYQDFRPPAAPVADAWPEPALEPAARSARFWAKCVDGLTVIGLLLGVGVLAAVAIPALLAYRRGAHASQGLTLAAGIGFGAALLLAFVALVAWNCVWLHRYGQTVGKRALGIMIVRGDGSRASLGRIFLLRYLPMMILGALPLLGPLITLTDILLIFRDNRLCLHDHIADTRVVKAG
jgi:uncharacterized RDD family membrane protein YckC